MFEKQKEWCKDKVEKGKDWVRKNKFFLGYATGVVATIGGCFVLDKILEPKEKIGQVYRGDFDKGGLIDFGIGIIQVDRFGKEHIDDSHILLLQEGSKETLFSQIEEAIADTKAERNKKG